MDLDKLNKIIPEAIMVKDSDGGDYFYIPSKTLNKRKAWNKYLNSGFLLCNNKQFLQKDNIYLYNSKIKNHIVIQIAKEYHKTIL